MTGFAGARCRRLWISYPWARNEERDFFYLVPQLKEAGIEATYESLQLQPGVSLGQRIVQRLLSVEFDGWVYILTHQCFTRKDCADELVAALEQTLQHMGPEFPMVGLLHGVAAQQVPTALRVRPCVSLADLDWRHRLSEALWHRTPAHKNNNMSSDDSRFIWKIHRCYGGDPSLTAIEVCSKLESIQYWRFAIPKPARPALWGQGVAGGGLISPFKFAVAKGSGRYGSADVTWFGAGNGVSNTESAYAVFAGTLPDFVCFGPATEPFGPPSRMEVFRTGSIK